MWQRIRVEMCPDEGRAMRSNPLRRQAQRFGRRHSQPPIEFPCSAPQRDGKSPKTTGNPANVGLVANGMLSEIVRVECLVCLEGFGKDLKAADRITKWTKKQKRITKQMNSTCNVIMNSPWRFGFRTSTGPTVKIMSIASTASISTRLHS